MDYHSAFVILRAAGLASREVLKMSEAEACMRAERLLANRRPRKHRERGVKVRKFSEITERFEDHAGDPPAQFRVLMNYLEKRPDVWKEVLALLERPTGNPTVNGLAEVRRFSERHRGDLGKLGTSPEEFQRVFIRSGMSAKEFLTGARS